MEHFQRFLETQPDAQSASLEEIQALLRYRCSDSKARALVSPITVTEIVEALRALPNGKVSGPMVSQRSFL